MRRDRAHSRGPSPRASCDVVSGSFDRARAASRDPARAVVTGCRRARSWLAAVFTLVLLALLAPSVASADPARPGAATVKEARLEITTHYEAGATGPKGEEGEVEKTISLSELENDRDESNTRILRVSVPRLAAAVEVPPRRVTKMVVTGLENGTGSRVSLTVGPEEIITGWTSDELYYFEGTKHGALSETEIAFEDNERAGEARVGSGKGGVPGVLSVDLYVSGSVFTISMPTYLQEAEHINQPLAGTPVELFEHAVTCPDGEECLYTWRFDDGEERKGQETKFKFPALAAGGYQLAEYHVYVEVNTKSGNAGGVNYLRLVVDTLEGTPTHPGPTAVAEPGPAGPAGPAPGSASTGPAAPSGAETGSAAPSGGALRAPVSGPTGPAGPAAVNPTPQPSPHRARTPALRNQPKVPERHRADAQRSHGVIGGHGAGGPGAGFSTPGGTGPASAGFSSGTGETGTSAPQGTHAGNGGSVPGPPGAPKASAPHGPFPHGPPAPRGLVGVLLASAPTESAPTESPPVVDATPSRSALHFAKNSPVPLNSGPGSAGLFGWILGILAVLLLISLGALFEVKPRSLYRKLIGH
jgi:hypothetical protein